MDVFESLTLAKQKQALLNHKSLTMFTMKTVCMKTEIITRSYKGLVLFINSMHLQY